eukprot:1867403-Prorocentrum_lima.AAC.1
MLPSILSTPHTLEIVNLIPTSHWQQLITEDIQVLTMQLSTEQLEHWQLKNAFAQPMQLRSRIQDQPLEWMAL